MKIKEHLFDYLLVLIGNIVLAFAIAGFIIPNDILSGGLAGISIALYPVFHIEPQFLITVLTLIFFLVGSLILGKGFAIKTFLSSLLYPFFLNLFSDLIFANYQITTNPILGSIYGGIFLGLGVGLVFRTGASTGGMDIPPLIINKYTGIPLSNLVLCIDAGTVLLGAATHSIEAVMIGLFSVWTSSFVINKTLSFGGQSTKSIMIISDKYDELLNAIQVDLDRGATLIEAEGGYSREPRKIILVVILNKQYPMLNKLVMSHDPNAFMIVQDAMEVKGNGFTFFHEGEFKK